MSESIIRREVFREMMQKLVFLAFDKNVDIPKEDVRADYTGRILFNTYKTRRQLDDVCLDEFKERIANVGLIYSFKPEENK